MKRQILQIAGTALLAGTIVLFTLGADEPKAKAIAYKTVFVASVIPAAGQPTEAETTPDGTKLAQSIDVEIKKLANAGYEVVEVVPVTKGVYRWRAEQTVDSGGSNARASAYGYGYGFGVTSGVLIVAKQN